MSAKSQTDLLRVLETGEYTRVGGEQRLHSDARIVSATNRSTQDLIEEGTFREDLNYRLNVIPIQLPPLRNRREDIPLLVEHFLDYFCIRHKRVAKRTSPEAMEILVAAAWPGNVRQLRNVVERLVITCAGDLIQESELPTELRKVSRVDMKMPISLSEAMDECEKATIQLALEACNLHREHTAKSLGISLRTLHYKMGRYGLH